MNPVDAWWNRNFPPHSIRRLAFLLAWVPLFSALTLWAGTSFIGARFSWLLVLYMSLATCLIVALGWMVAVREARPSIPRPLSTGRAPRKAPEMPMIPHPPTHMPEKVRTDWRIDFALATAIFWVGLTMALLVMGLGASIQQVAINAIVALAFGFTLTSRFSLASLVVLSLLIGFGGALLLQLFLLILSGQDDFFLYWGVSSVVVFAFAYPLWQQMQRSRGRWEAIPSWAIATGTACLLMITAAISEIL